MDLFSAIANIHTGVLALQKIIDQLIASGNNPCSIFDILSKHYNSAKAAETTLLNNSTHQEKIGLIFLELNLTIYGDTIFACQKTLHLVTVHCYKLYLT